MAHKKIGSLRSKLVTSRSLTDLTAISDNKSDSSEIINNTTTENASTVNSRDEKWSLARIRHSGKFIKRELKERRSRSFKESSEEVFLSASTECITSDIVYDRGRKESLSKRKRSKEKKHSREIEKLDENHSQGTTFYTTATTAGKTIPDQVDTTRPPALSWSSDSLVIQDLLHEYESDILEVNSASMESLDEGGNEGSSQDYIDADPELRLLDKEPELWVHTVDKEVVEQLKEKQVKKQEHIYELIITEKHHCRTLKVMQKLFAEGMARELNMQKSRIKRIFPCLDDLISLHFSFLARLRHRQRGGKYIETIGDLLVDQFTGENAQGLKDAYGQFCSQHMDAVSFYKDMLKTDRRFQAFITQKSADPLMKKKNITECILSVTHRVTKYPLMIEALMKYSRDQAEELLTLKKALDLVKEILVNINAQVAEKEREQKLLEIYHKIDAKSSAIYKDQKFKKSDFFSRSRKLK